MKICSSQIELYAVSYAVWNTSLEYCRTLTCHIESALTFAKVHIVGYRQYATNFWESLSKNGTTAVRINRTKLHDFGAVFYFKFIVKLKQIVSYSWTIFSCLVVLFRLPSRKTLPSSTNVSAPAPVASLRVRHARVVTSHMDSVPDRPELNSHAVRPARESGWI